MSATGGKVGTGAGLGSFWLLSVEDLQALCMDASKTRGTGFLAAVFKICRSGMYLQLHNMQLTSNNCNNQVWNKITSEMDPSSIHGRSAATMK